jgi:hypothetical protein
MFHMLVELDPGLVDEREDTRVPDLDDAHDLVKGTHAQSTTGLRPLAQNEHVVARSEVVNPRVCTSLTA